MSESLATRLCEKGLVPDALTRLGIRRLCAARLREERVNDLDALDLRFRVLLAELRKSPLAIHTQEANSQHYEVPPPFFQKALGARLKYSSCYYPNGNESLDQAEEAMLALSSARAELVDGQDILELGCGWGSLTLWMAEKYPNSRITAVSNSAPQRAFILARAGERGLSNVQVLTEDVNHLQLEARFDRVVSVEMFEHVRNYETLFARIASWLEPGGKLFAHVFCHKQVMYPFETEGEHNWMGRHFFTGGLMPAASTFMHFQRDLQLEEHWLMSGRHYQQTSEHWLQNLDRHREAVLEVFEQTYGPGQARLWLQRWRMFFMACAELFGYAGGSEWGVGHYRMLRR